MKTTTFWYSLTVSTLIELVLQLLPPALVGDAGPDVAGFPYIAKHDVKIFDIQRLWWQDCHMILQNKISKFIPKFVDIILEERRQPPLRTLRRPELGGAGRERGLLTGVFGVTAVGPPGQRMPHRSHPTVRSLLPSVKNEEHSLEKLLLHSKAKDLDEQGIEPWTTHMLSEYYTTKPFAQRMISPGLEPETFSVLD